MRRGFFRSYNPGRDTRWGTAHGGNPPAWWLFQQAQLAASAAATPDTTEKTHTATPENVLQVIRAADRRGLLKAEVRTAAQMIGLAILWGEKPPDEAVARVAAVVPEVERLLELLKRGEDDGTQERPGPDHGMPGL